MSFGKKVTLMSVAAILSIFAAVSIANAVMQPPQVKQQPISLNADKIFTLVNEQRVKAGVQPLTRDNRFDVTSSEHLNDMLTYNYTAHVNPVTGKDPTQFLGKYLNTVCQYVGENLAWQYTSEEATVNGWMNSKSGHREAMLNPKYTLSGISVNGTIVVQHFCQVK